MLRAGDAEISNGGSDVLQPVASSSKTGLAHPFPSPSPLTPLASPNLGDVLDSVDGKAQPTSKKKRGKNNGKRRANKASKWADRCMYAELLEMCSDEPWSRGNTNNVHGNTLEDYERVDGLPRDLETGWVAVAPVPVGKRCLAVTQQSAGVAGVGMSFLFHWKLLGPTLLFLSSEHDTAISTPWKITFGSISICFASFNSVGLYFGCELERKWNLTRVGRRQMERARCRRLRGWLQVGSHSPSIGESLR